VAAATDPSGSLLDMAANEHRTDHRADVAGARGAGVRGGEVDALPAELTREPFEPDEPPPPSRAERAASWLRATPAELAGLAILLVGAMAVSVTLWTGATARPGVLPAADGDAGAATVGQRVGSEADGAEAPPSGQAPGTPTMPAGPGSELAADPPPVPVPDPPPVPAPDPPGPVTVHVSGAVHRPGLVELPPGSRVGHAIEAAGGLGPGADLATVNLARPLSDGEQVHVLREGEAPQAPGAATDPPAAGAGGAGVADPVGAGGGIDAEGRVDLNRATAAELETLPGIGPAKAAAIVEHRETHGPYAEPGDIRAVSGIGEKTFQQLADRITTG
jgi:competence protein ComEA